MNAIFQINNWKAIILAYQIAYTKGLKSGQQITTEVWQEVRRRHPNWIEFRGMTELNQDEFAKEAASHGNNVLMIKRKNQ